jgi:hypothetical protein
MPLTPPPLSLSLSLTLSVGYPELVCPGIERRKGASLVGVPIISANDLQLMQVAPSDVIGEGAFSQVHRVEIPNAWFVAYKRYKSGVDVEVMKREAGMRVPLSPSFSAEKN